MPDPQAIASFPGISRILGATMTHSEGVTPSPIFITADHQPQVAEPVGTFTIQYGRTVLKFPDCAVDFSTVRRGRANTVTFQLLDRRWKWRPQSGGGAITLRANVRRKDGTIDESTELTPQLIAAYIFDAMGERGWSVAELPNDTRPEIDWVAENPSIVLASLAESLGCRVVMGLDNRARIRRSGFGAFLPIKNVMTPAVGFNPPEKPDSLLFVGGPSLWQSKLLLEAVGEDRDGQILPINSLFYRPAGGWEQTTPGLFDAVADDRDRKLAQKSVFKWYRIKSQADGTQNVPGYGVVIGIKDLLPIRDVQVATSPDKDGVEVPRPAQVEGVFNDNVGDFATFTNTAAGTVYKGGFSIDVETGIVKFNDPVYKQADAALWALPAELYLLTSYSITNQETFQRERAIHFERLPGRPRGTGPRVVKRERLQASFRAVYENDPTLGLAPGRPGGANPANVVRVDNNEKIFRTEAIKHLRNVASEYQTVQTAEGEWIGIVPIDLDGAIEQVTWTLGNGSPATTRASRNSEHSFIVPSKVKRRMSEQMQNFLLTGGVPNVMGVHFVGDRG